MAALNLPKRPNVVLIITDQQSWNPDWTDTLPVSHGRPVTFPAMQKLIRNGIVFNNAICNSCTCSPSRTTLFTGKYPAHHGVEQVLAFDDPTSGTQQNQGVLPNNIQNMAKMMASADYQVAYKGKWHITKPTQYVKSESALPEADDKAEFNRPSTDDIDQRYWTPDDPDHLAKLYGFKGWTYPDAGDDQNIFNFGGGHVNNDRRFVNGRGQSALYGNNPPIDTRVEDSALEYIKKVDTKDGKKPFFMVVSLVNPHDVLSYPGNATIPRTGELVPYPLYKLGGYRDRDFDHIEIELPSTLDEKLITKPKIQRQWREVMEFIGPVHSEPNSREIARKYLQFYAYVSSLVDHEIDQVMDQLKERNFIDDTLIVRIADHGDMSMAHGMQRQKMYNVYRETLNVPMIFSHPSITETTPTESLAGLIDLMPTMAEIAGIQSHEWQFQGNSLMDILTDPDATVQDYVHFTYDDDYTVQQLANLPDQATIPSSGKTVPTPQDMGATHIRCIIKDDQESGKRWKYAVYYDPYYGLNFEYELYDLSNDFEEACNLAFPGNRVAETDLVQQRLHDELIIVMKEKGTLPDNVLWPEKTNVA